MELEQTLRLACAPREPGVDFEDAVMARVNAAAWRAAQVAPRRRRRIVLISALIVTVAAAASFAVWHYGSSPPVETQLAQAVTTPPTGTDAPEGTHTVVPAKVPGATAGPPTEPTDPGLCALADATPMAPSYTVQVRPLYIEIDDPVIKSRMQVYYDAVLDQLRNVPGLSLVGVEARTLATRPADFLVSVAGVNNSEAASLADRAEWLVKLQLEVWTGNAFGKAIFTQRPGNSLDSAECRLVSGPITRCGPAGRAAMDVQILMGKPGDPVNANARLSTFPTPARVACAHEAQKRAPKVIVRPTVQLSTVLQMIERLAVDPVAASRYNSRNTLRSQLRPEHAQSLLMALRESTDDAFRNEVVTVLAVNFAGDPVVREALAALVASGTDTLMRHVAERALTGDGPWSDFAVARVQDTSLSPAQRLEAWYWIADALPLDQQKMSATISEMLTAQQADSGMHVLADLLAATQKNPADPGYGVAGQQGQMAMRQIGSVNHPAAPELLIACFDAEPNYITLGVLATRRDDPRVVGKLESIAAEHPDAQLRRLATSRLSQPLDPTQTAPAGN